jgi:heme/copper-type cytochrome/quinol oxidase subunit 1
VLPLAWCAAALVIAAVDQGPLGVASSSATFYVVEHKQYVLSLSGACLVFAAAYLLIGRVSPRPYTRVIAWAHFALMILGSALVLSPRLALQSSGMPGRYADPTAAFALWRTLSSVGYTLTLLGLLAFAIALVGIFAHRRL